MNKIKDFFYANCHHIFDMIAIQRRAIRDDRMTPWSCDVRWDGRYLDLTMWNQDVSGDEISWCSATIMEDYPDNPIDKQLKKMNKAAERGKWKSFMKSWCEACALKMEELDVHGNIVSDIREVKYFIKMEGKKIKSIY